MEDRTTIQVYRSDAVWLRAKQREVSFRRGQYIAMCDLVRMLIKRASEGEENGGA